MSDRKTNLENNLQDAIIELGKEDLTLAYQAVAGSFVGISELLVKQNGYDPSLDINLNGGNRNITIHAVEDKQQ